MKFIIIFFIILSVSNNAFANEGKLEKLFYLATNATDLSFNKKQLENIKSHVKSIDILAPQVFTLHKHGAISGKLDPELIKIAKENKIKIMPLIVNTNFDQEAFHYFLHDPIAQRIALVGMINLCKRYQLYGLQFDFENIHINDKNNLTTFIQMAANKLHQNGFLISVAVVPHATETLQNDYDRWFFENWSGAYGYQHLGEVADFISIMSYDRHTSLTTPGPIAPIAWVEKIIKGLIKVVPAKKISLGVPTYSGLWSTGKLGPKNIPEKFMYRAKELQIEYSMVLSLLKKFKQPLIWQNQWQSSYVMYSNNDRNEYLFVEDKKSFAAKLRLAKRFQLRGISVWQLGWEDSSIWPRKENL